jgi:hypothetical protein
MHHPPSKMKAKVKVLSYVKLPEGVFGAMLNYSATQMTSVAELRRFFFFHCPGYSTCPQFQRDTWVAALRLQRRQRNQSSNLYNDDACLLSITSTTAWLFVSVYLCLRRGLLSVAAICTSLACVRSV